MQQVDHGGGSLAFRMDDWRQRFVVTDEPGDELAFMGWQVERSEDLDDFGARLERAGVVVTEAGGDLCDRRFVERMIFCDDPDGNRVELFATPRLATDPFSPHCRLRGF